MIELQLDMKLLKGGEKESPRSSILIFVVKEIGIYATMTEAAVHMSHYHLTSSTKSVFTVIFYTTELQSFTGYLTSWHCKQIEFQHLESEVVLIQ